MSSYPSGTSSMRSRKGCCLYSCQNLYLRSVVGPTLLKDVSRVEGYPNNAFTSIVISTPTTALRMSTPAWKVYAQELLRRSHGFPLWYPEPTKFEEVEIGDVGFINEGRFYRLFNACREKHDPINKGNGVPDGFVPLEIPPNLLHRHDEYLSPGPVCSVRTRCRKIDMGAGAAPPT